MAREDIALLEQMADLREQVRGMRREQTDAAVANALELIRSETRLAVLRSQISEKQAERQQLVRRIAVLAGLPAEQVRLRPRDPGARVEPAYLDAAALTDLAFLRRPDLRKALQEKEAAEHGVKAARAAQVPWLEYVEGSYEGETGHATSSEEFVAGSERSNEDETEWQARVAVTLPVFNWLGDEVRLSRTRLAAAEARAQGLYDTIRREVEGVLEDYRSVRSERERVVAESKRLCDSMTAQIDALASETAVRREDVLAAREELVAYVRVCMKVEREYMRLTDYLETVSGGSLAPAQ
jgi:outer membrane protein TolC